MPADVIIPDRAGFMDALGQLRHGRVLVRAADTDKRCLLDGSFVCTACQPLARYRPIDEFKNPEGFPNVHSYRLSPRGEEFSDPACETWRCRPLLQRLAMRPTGRNPERGAAARGGGPIAALLPRRAPPCPTA